MSFTYLQYNVFIISIQDMHHNVSILIWETHWDGHGINSGQRPVVHTDIGNALNLTDTLYGYCCAVYGGGINRHDKRRRIFVLCRFLDVSLLRVWGPR